MGGSKKGPKNDSHSQQNGRNSSVQDTVPVSNTPPTVLTQAPIQNNGNQITSQTENLMGQAREILYGAPNQMTLNDFNAQPYVHQSQQPNTQNLQMRAQVTPLQGSQFIMPTIAAENQYNPMLCNSAMNSNGSCVEAPPWVNAMMKNLDSRLQNIESQLSSQNQRWQQIENQIQSQNTRMLNIEQKVSQVNNMKQNITQVQLQVSDMDVAVKNFHTKVTAYDSSIEHFNDLCDGIIQQNAEKSRYIDDLNDRLTKLETEQTEIREKQHNIEEKVTDLQWRSMRENLLFTGINELDAINEDTEYILRNFLQTEMNINYDIPFDRIHRLGKFDPTKAYPRPIIAKFEKFTDRERVRLAAPKALNGTPYGVREQFPIEIESKRRELYPIMKQYKQDKQNKVVLVRDKLYVNDVQYIPETDNKKQTGNKRNGNMRQRNTTNSRVFTRRQNYDKDNQRYQRPTSSSTNNLISRNRTSTNVTTTDDIMTPNPWRHLNNVNDDNELTPQTGHGKKKATSPLEDLAFTKKQRNDEIERSGINDNCDKTIPITISEGEISCDELMETPSLPDTVSKCENINMPLNQNSVLTPVGDENTGSTIASQSKSRDSSPDRNAVSGEEH